MILNELVLHNVGTFAGRHVIDFSTPSAAKPIVLIGGLNGAGKTTILESIQLALYGPLARSSGRRSRSYDNYLRGLIHRGVPQDEGAAIELTFTAHQEGVEHRYWICRSWKSVGASIREILLVSVDGRHSPSLKSTWNEYVETFLPRGIAGLFFFDGEQIEALADLERSQEVIGSALTALLGLDLVERLSTDLSVLKRRHRSENVPTDLRQTIDEKRQLVTAQRQLEERCRESEAARLSELELRQKLFHEATEAYRSSGGDLLEQREATETKAAMVRANLSRHEEEIREELAGEACLLQIPELLCQLDRRAASEKEATRNSLLVETLVARDEALLHELASAKATSATTSMIRQFLRRDLEGRRASAAGERIVALPDHAALTAVLSVALPAARKRLNTAVERRAELRAELDQTERVLAAIPDPETLAPLSRQREAARDAVLRAETEYRVASEALAAARNDHAKSVAAYESALDKSTSANLALADDQRMLEHADRVLVTLANLRVTAARRHLDRISQLVLEALNILLRKQNLITDIQIDPETLTVSLTGSDGHALLAKDLSAGERQLLAVALLWGLARASGQPLPVVIDTPLGRLDGSHRGHLLDRYFPRASHQVVLLSTDTEIDAEAVARISPHVGRSYRLEFDPATSATHIEDGYFQEK